MYKVKTYKDNWTKLKFYPIRIENEVFRSRVLDNLITFEMVTVMKCEYLCENERVWIEVCVCVCV